MLPESWEYKPNCEILEGQTLPDGIFRISMGVEYDGAAYFGWQRQRLVESVQENIEKALSQIADHPIEVVCAGRTDAGVHATSQVIHFDTRAQRKERNWMLGVNSRLPRDIAVTWSKAVPGQFHARFSAQARTYRYIIFNREYSPAVLNRGLTWWRRPLDVEKMERAAAYLVGEHDFSSFRAAGCVASNPVRVIHSAIVRRIADYVVLEITANAFLQHMVRNIVGLLLEIGSSDAPPHQLQKILDLKDRRQSAATARPNGLYFVDVEYPPEFSIPRPERGPSFIRGMLQQNGTES